MGPMRFPAAAAAKPSATEEQKVNPTVGQKVQEGQTNAPAEKLPPPVGGFFFPRLEESIKTAAEKVSEKIKAYAEKLPKPEAKSEPAPEAKPEPEPAPPPRLTTAELKESKAKGIAVDQSKLTLVLTAAENKEFEIQKVVHNPKALELLGPGTAQEDSQGNPLKTAVTWQLTQLAKTYANPAIFKNGMLFDIAVTQFGAVPDPKRYPGEDVMAKAEREYDRRDRISQRDYGLTLHELFKKVLERRQGDRNEKGEFLKGKENDKGVFLNEDEREAMVDDLMLKAGKGKDDLMVRRLQEDAHGELPPPAISRPEWLEIALNAPTIVVEERNAKQQTVVKVGGPTTRVEVAPGGNGTATSTAPASKLNETIKLLPDKAMQGFVVLSQDGTVTLEQYVDGLHNALTIGTKAGLEASFAMLNGRSREQIGTIESANREKNYGSLTDTIDKIKVTDVADNEYAEGAKAALKKRAAFGFRDDISATELWEAKGYRGLMTSKGARPGNMRLTLLGLDREQKAAVSGQLKEKSEKEGEKPARGLVAVVQNNQEAFALREYGLAGMVYDIDLQDTAGSLALYRKTGDKDSIYGMLNVLRDAKLTPQQKGEVLQKSDVLCGGDILTDFDKNFKNLKYHPEYKTLEEEIIKASKETPQAAPSKGKTP